MATVRSSGDGLNEVVAEIPCGDGERAGGADGPAAQWTSEV